MEWVCFGRETGRMPSKCIQDCTKYKIKVSLHISIHPSLHPSTDLSCICLSILPWIHPPTHPHIHPSICPITLHHLSICSSLHLSNLPSTYASIHLFLLTSVRSPVHPPLCPPSAHPPIMWRGTGIHPGEVTIPNNMTINKLLKINNSKQTFK